MCFFGQYSVFVNFLAKVLYCPKKTNPFLQKCCTVPKKPKNQFFQVLGPRSAICLSIRLVFLRQYSTFTKKIVFLGQYSVFVNFLAKVLYCPKKTNLFLQKCCTVPKKPQKNNLFQSCCPARSQDLKRLVFFGFFWDSTALLQKKIVFLGQYSVFVNFLAKVLYCPKKTNLFLQKCCTVPKKPKSQSFPVLLPCEVPGPEKIVFFGFFGTVQHFSKKRLVFWDSTVFFVNFLAKVLYCPKKTNLFLQKCCTVPKNQSCGRPVVGSSLKTEKIVFLVFLGQYSTFAKKDWFFLGQYNVFVNVLTNVLYCPKKTIIYCKSGHVARLSLEAFRKPQTLNPNPRPWKSKVGMPSRTSRS